MGIISGHCSAGAGVAVTIVETSKVGVMVGMVGKGVIEDVGDGIVLSEGGTIVSGTTCVGVSDEQALSQKIKMEMRIYFFLPIKNLYALRNTNLSYYNAKVYRYYRNNVKRFCHAHRKSFREARSSF